MAVVERNPFSVIPGGAATAQQPQMEESELEIEIEDPEGAEELGYQTTEINPEMEAAQQDHYANLAEFLDDEELKEIGETVAEAYEADKESRAEWESTFERGFDLLGLKLQETTEPFEGSCPAVSPLIIESAVKFQSKATIELFPAGGPVRTQIVGSVSPEREDQANRVQNFMNYQFTEQITEYFDEFEKMLFHLPLIGSAFKKMYYDPSIRRPCSEFVPVDQFYVSYHASDLQKAERYTHVIFRTPNEMDRDIVSGMYKDSDLSEATAPDPDSFTSKIDSIMGISPAENYDLQYVLLEQHCHLDLPDPFSDPDGVALPYVVTVEEESHKVVAIRRNWSKEDQTQTKQTYFTHYKFVPGFGFYGLGLIHLLGNMTMSATSALRSLVDAGQFANLPGGFKARGVRVVGGNDPIAPGEFREVEATGLDLQKSIVPLPYKEPSQTLYNMLNWLTQAGQKFADQTEQIVNESSNYGPVGTTMALIESSAKFFSAIHKRLHKSQRDEFRLLAKINFEFLPDEYPYDVPNITSSVFKSDFDGRVDVLPVSDPNVPSAAHRLSMAQMVLQLSSQAPQGLYNVEQVHLSIMKAANIQNPERFFTPKTPPKPQDPITDIETVVKGMPIQAFPQQDHKAHIAIKTAFIEDPSLGKTEIMAPVVPVLQANIQQHMVMLYQQQMSGMMQMELQKMGQSEQQGQVDPQILSQLSIDAAEKILQASTGEGGAESIEQQNMVLEGARLDLEQQKMQMTATKDAAELAIKSRELDLKEMDVKLSASTKVAEKNQKQMDARIREDDSIRGTKTQIIVTSLKNMLKERELMIKKREQETRYAQGGSIGFAEGGSPPEKWWESLPFASEVAGTLVNLGFDPYGAGDEEVEEIRSRLDEPEQTPFMSLMEMIKKGMTPSTQTEPSRLDSEEGRPPVAVSKPAEEKTYEELTQVEPVMTRPETGVLERRRFPLYKEPLVDAPPPVMEETAVEESMEQPVEAMEAPFKEKFIDRMRLTMGEEFSPQDFNEKLDQYTKLVALRESTTDTQAKNPKSSATGMFQAINDNRKTNAKRIINRMGGKHNVPEWIKKAAESMSDEEHEKFMKSLSAEQQKLLFIAQLFEHKGSDKLIMSALKNKWDKKSMTDLYMKTHHLGTGKQGERARELFGKDYTEMFSA